jgi:hypothetical protein
MALTTLASDRYPPWSEAGLCDNGGGPERCLRTAQGLTTQLKPDRRRAAMAVTKRTQTPAREVGDGSR